MRNDLKKLRTTFTPVYTDATKKCKAWYAMSPAARELFLEIKMLYIRETEEAVYMSTRHAAKLLGIAKLAVATRLLRELEHYGYLVKISGGYLGANGRGIATSRRLTDEPYQGAPATLDFLKWDGTLLETKSRAPKGYIRPCTNSTRGS